MKSRFTQKLIFALLSCFFTSGVSFAQQDSSSTYGYHWKSNLAPGGPTYSWVDIKDGTKVLSLADDNFAGPFDIGFGFQYYWASYSKIYIGSNGYIMFGKGVNIASENGFPTFPVEGAASTPNNYIAALLCDLTLTDGQGGQAGNAAVYYKTIGDSFIVSFEEIPYWTNENVDKFQGSNTFQFILNRLDSTITINYKERIGGVASTYMTSYQSDTANFHYLTSGFENITGKYGLEIMSNNYPLASTSVRIYPPSVVPAISFKDVRVDWVLNNQNGGEFLSKDSALYFASVQLTNTGNVDIDFSTPINVYLQYFDYLGNKDLSKYRDTTVITSLTAGESKIRTFTKGYPATDTMDLKVYIYASLTGDQYPGNNASASELVVVDTDAETSWLAYDKFYFKGESSFDPTAGDGRQASLELGNYYKPPFYPCAINKLNFGMIVGDNGPAEDTLLGFFTKIYKDDGPNGTPGTQMYSQAIDRSAIKYTPGKFLNDQIIDITTPFIIDSGGIYVSYKRLEGVASEEESALDGIASESSPSVPISSRTFEITGGSWAAYRAQSSSEIAIRVGVSHSLTSRGKNEGNIKLALWSCYPNPASGLATLSYELEAASDVNVEVRNAMGQTVSIQKHGMQTSGIHTLKLGLNTLADGVYIYTLCAGSERASGRIAVVN